MKVSDTIFEDDSVSALFRWWLRSMGWFVRIIPFCIVLGLPVVMVYDRFRPWPVALNALTAYPGQSRMCIGNSSSSDEKPDGYHWSVQRAFILFPRVLSSPSVIFVTTTESVAAKIEESRFAFWFFFVCYGLIVIYCIRRVRILRSIHHTASNATTKGML